MKPAPATCSQIHYLVVGFYREVSCDDLLGPVFRAVAETELAWPDRHRGLEQM